MAHNDEAGGSGGKAFWELSQEMEEQPHRCEDAAEDTDPDYTTPSGVGDDTTDGAAEDATTDDGGARRWGKTRLQTVGKLSSGPAHRVIANERLHGTVPRRAHQHHPSPLRGALHQGDDVEPPIHGLLDAGEPGPFQGRGGVQHHGSGSDGIDAALAQAGARVAPFVVYRWGPAPDPAAVTASTREAAAGEIDVVVFTSAPAVASWWTAAEEAGVADAIVRRSRDDLLVAAVGPVTAAPLRAKGVEPLVPERSRMGALIRAVLLHFGDAGD
mgnify:CR=1 FL=1